MKKLILIGAAVASSFTLAGCQFGTGNAGERTERGERADRSESNRDSGREEGGRDGGEREAPGRDESARGGEARGGDSVQIASASDSSNQNFRLNNRSDDVITHVYVSSVSDNNWGPDVLGTQVIPAGQYATITFPRQETECNWDIRVTINNDSNTEMRNVNLCRTSEVNYN